jgi:DNA repair exonuclease SbcCD ATPase subunit
MNSQKVDSAEVRLKVENIGGIKETEVSFSPGVTVLTGRNATNRTSLLRAIMAGLGSDRVSLKGDADSGSVTLQFGNKSYTRSLQRQNNTMKISGDAYLDDSELADLFAFLLESNEARRAVALEQDLRDIIMQPVDADAIQAEIRQLRSERDNVDDRIEERKKLREKLPELEQRRRHLTQEIETKTEELENKREKLNDLSADAEEARSEQSELDQKMQTLQQKRSSLDTTEFRLDSERESLASIKQEREEIEAEYDDLMDQEMGDLDHIESEISRLRGKKKRLERELNKLQNVIQFNEEMLEGTSTDIAAALRGDDTDNVSVTDKILEDSKEVVCWTCGTEVNVKKIENTLDRLRNFRQSKSAEQTSIEEELSELKKKRSDIQSTRQRRDNIKDRLADIKAEIEKRESKIEELETKKDELEDEIEHIKTEIEELEEQDRSEVLDVHREVNEIELEIDRLENERGDVSKEIEDIESKEKEVETLQDRREQITEQLDELRTRIERIEKEAIKEFNHHMGTVLELLDYGNLDRIWVERLETESRQGRRKVDTTEFRLHIVRTSDEGVTYEDDFEHLSESEREVMGLIFALAGYLAHDVHEEVPFILLDSLESIDSERIARVIDYMQEYTDYLVVALLPEDSAALDEDYQRVAEI